MSLEHLKILSGSFCFYHGKEREREGDIHSHWGPGRRRPVWDPREIMKAVEFKEICATQRK